MQSNSLEGANAEGTVLADGCGECLHHHMVCEVCPKCHKKPDSSTRLYVDIRHDLIQEKWQQALASERRHTDNGRTYTRQQLFLLYGERGLAMWEAAAAEPVSEPSTSSTDPTPRKHAGERATVSAPKRRCAGDGRTYTKREFLSFYGDEWGCAMWQAAAAEPSRCCCCCGANIEKQSITSSRQLKS